MEESGDLLVQNFNHSAQGGDTWRPYHSDEEEEDSAEEDESDDDSEEAEEESDYEVDRLGNRIEKNL